MNVQIRPALEGDYPAVAALMTAANPRHPVSTQALEESARKARTHPRGLHLAQWVAQHSGKLVGFAGVAQWAGSYHADRYHAVVNVPPDHARRGIGSALADVVTAHLEARNAREVLAGAFEDEPHALRFLQRRGFVEVGRDFDSVLTLADFQAERWAAQAQLPEGYRRLTLAELIAEQGEEAALDAFRQCFNEARADEPRPIPAQPYSAQDMQTYLQHPTYLPDGLQLAVTPENEVAALSELWLEKGNPHRLNTGLTGTARAHRRRGLALALKLAALDVARRHGAREVWTSNATINRPMLALNERLGFRPQVAWIELKRGNL